MWYACCLKKNHKKTSKHNKTVHFEDVTNPLIENDSLSRTTTIDNNHPNQIDIN